MQCWKNSRGNEEKAKQMSKTKQTMRHTATPCSFDWDFNPYLRLRTFIKHVKCLFNHFTNCCALMESGLLSIKTAFGQLTWVFNKFITIYWLQKGFVGSSAKWHRLCVGSRSLDPVSVGALYNATPPGGRSYVTGSCFPGSFLYKHQSRCAPMPSLLNVISL